MPPIDGPPQYNNERKAVSSSFQAVTFFIITIAAVGAVMITLIGSPGAKGVSFLWLPAALQLMAGVWLGPWRGMLAGGLGAYLAGILANGGWGPIPFIMNGIAGGVANSFLPGILFRSLKIDPTFGINTSRDPLQSLQVAGRTATLLGVVLILAFAMKPLQIGLWGYSAPLVLLLLTPFVLTGLSLRRSDFALGFLVSVVSCAISAAIGAFGQVVGGQTWQAAIISTGSIVWFLGDTVSAVFAMYMLAAFTERARDAGVATI
jgi:hypothetical protein